ncbi:MAG: protein-L-isoaspartate(D-aspartate) O-methyltransferase [Planctomycetota bacterium]
MTETLDEMIRFDIQERGINDARVLDAFRRVDRIHFVSTLERSRAYEDHALILSHGQTLSQPYMVGLMTQALQLTGVERVLEIGTGSGYQTGILACLAKDVYTVERIEYLATTAEDRLLGLGFTNIRFHLGDGSHGWLEHAPYNRIIVTAACPRIPQSLINQLAEDGSIVAPVGPPESQILTIGTKKAGHLDIKTDTPCLFVKLIGSEGYAAATDLTG